MSKSKPFQGFNHGTGDIILTTAAQMMRPVQIHLKENGTKDNQPSLCMVMTNGFTDVYGEISVRMFNDGLADIGYKLVKNEVEENASKDQVQH